MGAGAYYNFQKYGDIWGPQRFPGAEPEHVLLSAQAGEMSATPKLPSPHVLAAQHPEALAYLRAHGPPAAACGGRFTDAELMRCWSGRASRERSGKRAAQEYGNVIVSLVQGALEGGRLRDTPEAGPQDLVVRVDAAGATVLSSARILPVVRHVALSMNQHYPGRLHRMELHHLPSFAVWLVSAVRQLMHATTRDKVVVVDASGAVTKA
ncbi:hypothetical protein QBZ16_000583 [Prototheca wickerhamii]|uniref:CRAL-TRIO domain-containing protein n=1 Tax=Prototheca wickerhamii TaxID=3111 RepID=A0AAD9MIV9_PROWI|nr:hypothetical protein QBZ16_000583 [Prototheca wickerhamii]